MSMDLKPCPFCGGRNINMTYRDDMHIPYSTYVMYCTDCGGSVYPRHPATEAEVIEAWNTRAERTCYNTQSDGDFMCSECRKIVDDGGIIGFNYCPGCGAKVVEG